ncbi:MAG: M20/M25/M40 family metallo-hydrolase, partial [Nitrospirae bacterium]|nr:M20/M25/M40 family metallo-hydrolase [Nitrospirota bacterium]
MEAVKYVNINRVMSTFVELIRINSPSFDERAIGAHLASVLLRLGLEVTVQEYGESFNLIGYMRGSLRDVPTLILSAHMDTVEPTDGLNFANEDGIIRSVGETVLGSDDKSGLAEIIEALEAISESKVPHGDIEVVFTSAEERGLQGSKNLDYNVLKGRHAIVMDTNGPIGKIVVAAPTHD